MLQRADRKVLEEKVRDFNPDFLLAENYYITNQAFIEGVDDFFFFYPPPSAFYKYS